MEFERIKDELLSAVDSGLKYARRVDNDADFEIYLYCENRTRVGINQGVVDASDVVVEGNAIRVAKQNSVSFASSSGISADRIQRSINEAVASLKTLSIKDARFKGFCNPEKPGKEGKLSKKILSLNKEELISFASDIVKEGQKFDKRIQAVGSQCYAEWRGFAIGNTLGIQQASRAITNGFETICIAVEGQERRTGYEFNLNREELIEPTGSGAKAAQKAVSLLGAKKLSMTAVLPTIWTPTAAACLILASLGQSATGDNVVEGRSPLSDRIGKDVSNQKLTVTDDGQNPSGINTDAIDGEGHPQQKNILIERGKLKQFLFDTYYANIQNRKSTGNSIRHYSPFGSTLPYEVSPAIRPKNLEIKPGNKDLDELMSSTTGQAIMIMDMPIGIFHSNVATGEFSAVAQSAFLIKNGAKSPLQPVSVSGNFYKGYQNLLDVGSDLERTVFVVETPSLVFDGFSVVG